jgi:hypothetical protein
MNAAITSGTLLDKRLLLQERPTQIHAQQDPIEAGLRLLKAKGITIESTATEIPADNPNTQTPRTTLLGESQRAKGARVRATGHVQTAAD